MFRTTQLLSVLILRLILIGLSADGVLLRLLQCLDPEVSSFNDLCDRLPCSPDTDIRRVIRFHISSALVFNIGVPPHSQPKVDPCAYAAPSGQANSWPTSNDDTCIKVLQQG